MKKLSRSGGRRYGDIADELCADIRARKYAAEHSFPSLTKIMRRFNVTRVTAMRSVDELKRRGVVSAKPRSGLAVLNAEPSLPPREIFLPAQLVVRKSTNPASRHSLATKGTQG